MATVNTFPIETTPLATALQSIYFLLDRNTCASSLAIGTGTKVFTLHADKDFQPGDFIVIVSDANNANYMSGTVTSYSDTTLTTNITSIGGSGTHADWGIRLSGPPGVGATGATGPGYSATSTSSQTIGNSGTKTFTVAAGLAYSAGARVRAADASNPSTNWMEGVVSSYSSTTLVFTADKSAGSGTLTNWTINLAGQPGADGAGTGDVSAASNFGTDNRVVRSDGTTKGVQASGITLDDSNNLSPSTTDAGALGTTSLMWSDLFMATGAVINYNNGNYTLTHSSGVLTASGAFSLGTSNAFTCGTIELGAASDTTLSRSAAGVIAVEGVPIFSNVPQNSNSAAYTLVLADAQKHILHPSADTTARIFTIPANSSVAFPIGTAVTFVNQNAGGVITIAITTDTMRLAGAGTTGSRTLAANGIATALKITSTEWIISGTGLT